MTDDNREWVLLRRDGPVAILTINYPERRNAYGMGVKRDLMGRMGELMADRDCRAIVLTGAGGNFCAGGDISQMKARDFLDGRTALDTSHSLVRLMVNGPKPLIAAVEGYAYGAGMSLAAACDYVVTAASAKYCCAFVRIGLVPDMGLRWTLSQRVGIAKAKELMMLATEFDGTEAARLGLANEVAAPGAALDAAIAAGHRFAEKPPIALGLIKAGFARGSDALDDVLKSELDYQPVLKTTHDNQEAVKAFLEKRKPVFTGR